MTIPEMIQVLQAAERGEDVSDQYDLPYSVERLCRHLDLRIKPKPRMVPLEPSDVPPGSVFKREVWSKVEWFSVLRLNETGIEFATRGFVTWTKLMDWLISRDGGRTWSRCEKEAK